MALFARLAPMFAPLLLVAASCSEAPAERGPVVLAASSLTDALEEVADDWHAQGNARPQLSFAGTPALARQVAGGAPADVVLFADTEWMDELERDGLIDAASRSDLLGNRLVLVKRRGGPDLTLASIGQGRLALADPASVPAGRYARAALESLDLWQGVADRVVPAENVRAALALVERGEAELGIVYVSDAMASAMVEPVEYLPAASHPLIRYPLAVLSGSTHPDSAAFAAYLASDAAGAVFTAHGFDVVR